MHAIARFKIVNYRGVSFFDSHKIFPNGLPPGGLLIKGPNMAGKTSIVGALLAALTGADSGTDAIRIDEDRAEILIETDDLTIEKTLNREKQSRLVVRDDNGKPIKSPAEWLANVIGAALDPIAFMAKKPKDRKSYILSAIPLVVTPEQVTEWLEGWTLEAPEAIDYNLHGLEVVKAIRTEFFNRRKARNAVVKELEKEEEALIAGAPPAPTTAMSIEEADRLAHEAAAASAELRSRAARIEAHESRTKEIRERAEKLRADASTREETSHPDPDSAERDRIALELEAAIGVVATSDNTIGKIEAQIRELQERLTAARAARVEEARSVSALQSEASELARVVAAHDASIAMAASLRDQAIALEAAIAATSETAPTEAELADASAKIAAAQTEQANARAMQLRREHEAKVDAVGTKRAEETEAAAKLDAMVTKFTTTIPNELLEASNGIPGLSLGDDDEIYLDGVRLMKLSGREQLMFSVKLARRLARAKILMTDGLEKVDSDSLEEFITEATADGFQLIATRVTGGDSVTFEAIAPGSAT